MKSKKLIIIIASVLLFLAIIGTVLFFILGRDKAFVGEEGILYVKNGDMYYYDSSMKKPDLLIEKITEEEAAFEKFYAADVIKGESFILYSEAETGGSRVYYVNIKNQDKTGVFIDKDVTDYKVSKDGKCFVYAKTDNMLYKYDFKEGKKEAVNSDIGSPYFCIEGEDIYYYQHGCIYKNDTPIIEDVSHLYGMYEGAKMYYVKENSLYYYDKKENLITSDLADELEETYVDLKVPYAIYAQKGQTEGEMSFCFARENKTFEGAVSSSVCFSVSEDGNTLYYLTDISEKTKNGTLNKVLFKDGAFETPSEIDKEVYLYGKNFLSNGEFCYYKNHSGIAGDAYIDGKLQAEQIIDYKISENPEIYTCLKEVNPIKYEGTLYTVKDGKTQRIGGKISGYSVLNDGSVVYLTNVSAGLGNLGYFKDGKATILCEKVMGYELFEDGRIRYSALENDNTAVYIYQNGKSEKIAQNSYCIGELTDGYYCIESKNQESFWGDLYICKNNSKTKIDNDVQVAMTLVEIK